MRRLIFCFIAYTIISVGVVKFVNADYNVSGKTRIAEEIKVEHIQ